MQKKALGVHNNQLPTSRLAFLGGEVVLHTFEAVCIMRIIDGSADEASGMGILKVTNYRVFFSLFSTDRDVIPSLLSPLYY